MPQVELASCRGKDCESPKLKPWGMCSKHCNMNMLEEGQSDASDAQARLTYQVYIEQRAQDLATFGEGAEDLGGREGGVEEEAATNSVEAFAEEGGQHEQMVVMNPDIVQVHGNLLHELICKCLHASRRNVGIRQ